jgi:ketosteroid isomerase-like protein
MTPELAHSLVNIYAQAWIRQDANRILEIFTEDATYHDPAEGEVRGHDGIRNYWETKVIGDQARIAFTLLNLWIPDEDTVIAEWHATFDDTRRKLAIDMTEIAVFGVRGEKFCSLREYYRSTKKPL